MSEAYLAIQVVIMPRDTNPHSTICGRVIPYFDQAEAIGARRGVARAGGVPSLLVTVAMNWVGFRHPVLVGDVVRFMTRPVRIGQTSITMHIAVEAERADPMLPVTSAEVFYVAVHPNRAERPAIPLFPGS